MEKENPPSRCPNCDSPIRHVPAGISKKTGKPYEEFWSCDNRDCNFTWNRPKPKQAVGEFSSDITTKIDYIYDWVKSQSEETKETKTINEEEEGFDI
jgi:hypothetical protein